MGVFDRFVNTEYGSAARVRIPTQAEAARWRLPTVLALSLLALLVVLVGAPHGLAVVLVLAMMAGPVLWVVLPTAEVFAGVWHPEVTVGVVAVVLAAVASVLLVR